MGLFDSFPLSNAYAVNLDWIMKKIKEIEDFVKNYAAVNKVAYAGIWDITKQYPQWALVTDGDTSWLANKPVPVGIPLDNADYWQKLADLDPRIAGIIAELDKLKKSTEKNIASVREYAEKSPRIDVTKFGIVPDGVTDCGPAFAALNVPGNMLYFPAGKYLFKNRVDVEDMDMLFSPKAIVDGSFKIIKSAIVRGGQFSYTDSIFVANGTNFTLSDAVLSNTLEQDTMIAIHKGICSITNCIFNGGGTAHFCVWSDAQPNSVNLHVDSCIFEDVFLNAIFSGAAVSTVTNCTFRRCHKQTSPNGGGCVDFVGKDTGGTAFISSCLFTDFYAGTSGVELEHSAHVVAVGNKVTNKGGSYGFAIQNGGNLTLVGNKISDSPAVFTDNSSSVSGYNNSFFGTGATPYAINNPYAICILNETDFKTMQLYDRGTLTYKPIFPLKTMNNLIEVKNVAQNEHLRYSFKDGSAIRVKIGDGTEFLAFLHTNSVKIIGDKGNVGISASNSLLDIVNNGAQTTFEVYYL